MTNVFTGPTVTVTPAADPAGLARGGEGVPAPSSVEVGGAGTPVQAAIDKAATALRLARLDLAVLHCPSEDPQVRRAAGERALDQLRQTISLLINLRAAAHTQLGELPASAEATS